MAHINTESVKIEKRILQRVRELAKKEGRTVMGQLRLLLEKGLEVAAKGEL